MLIGQTITAVGGTSPSLRGRADSVVGAVVTAVRTTGKHLFIDLDTSCSIRVHLGMSGRWVVLDRSRVPHGSARLVLTTATHHVVCHSAPTVDVGRTGTVEARVSHLGPDLLADFDEDEFLRRARRLPDATLAHLVSNQRVLAGIGNVYKSELLFLEGIHPDTRVRSVGDYELLALARRARRLLSVNVGRARSTTGSPAVEGRETWVYGRTGLPCRRCHSAIVEERRDSRVTYWCPGCQPDPTG